MFIIQTIIHVNGHYEVIKYFRICCERKDKHISEHKRF